jgi:hypothetical protein
LAVLLNETRARRRANITVHHGNVGLYHHMHKYSSTRPTSRRRRPANTYDATMSSSQMAPLPNTSWMQIDAVSQVQSSALFTRQCPSVRTPGKRRPRRALQIPLSLAFRPPIMDEKPGSPAPIGGAPQPTAPCSLPTYPLRTCPAYGTLTRCWSGPYHNARDPLNPPGLRIVKYLD